MATVPQRRASDEYPVARRLTLFISALVAVFGLGLLLGVAFERDRQPSSPLDHPSDAPHGDSHTSPADSVPAAATAALMVATGPVPGSNQAVSE